MNVGTLKGRLKDIPNDAEVTISVKVKDGFYDVRSEWASAPATSFDYDEGRNRVELTS
jgi:hypothetical protein